MQIYDGWGTVIFIFLVVFFVNELFPISQWLKVPWIKFLKFPYFNIHIKTISFGHYILSYKNKRIYGVWYREHVTIDFWIRFLCFCSQMIKLRLFQFNFCWFCYILSFITIFTFFLWDIIYNNFVILCRVENIVFFKSVEFFYWGEVLAWCNFNFMEMKLYVWL